MKKTLKYFSIAVLTLLFLSPSLVVFAVHQSGAAHAPPGNGGASPPPVNYPITIENPLMSGTNTLPEFIELILRNVVIPIGSVIAVLFIVYAGFLYVTARGSEEKIKTAHRALLYAVIGTAILIGSWVISVAIKGTIDQIVAP